MTPALSRRQFVHSLALLLVAGSLGYSVRAEDPGMPVTSKNGSSSGASELLRQAQARMREEIKPGVVIVVPDKPSEREALARRLSQMLGGVGAPPAPININRAVAGQPPMPEEPRPVTGLEKLFCQAVFVCLPAKEVRTTFPTVPAGSVLVLLGPDGKPVDALSETPGLFEDRFVPTLTELLHGRRGERLSEFADAQRQALGASADHIDAAVRDLNSPRFRKREAAQALLSQSADRTTAILLDAHRKAPSLEARRRIERLLETVLTEQVEEPLLPVGLTWHEPMHDGTEEQSPRVSRRGIRHRTLKFATEN